jgi:hypothetical protein
VLLQPKNAHMNRRRHYQDCSDAYNFRTQAQPEEIDHISCSIERLRDCQSHIPGTSSIMSSCQSQSMTARQGCQASLDLVKRRIITLASLALSARFVVSPGAAILYERLRCVTLVSLRRVCLSRRPARTSCDGTETSGLPRDYCRSPCLWPRRRSQELSNA